jgi:uncharacterized membrane protein
MTAALLSRTQRIAWKAAAASWVLLIALCVLWEWQLAPVREGGSWLVLKAVPLLLPSRGVWRGDAYAMQWALLLVPLYFCEGVVRTFDELAVARLAWIEILLSLAFFILAITYLRPLKRARQARMAERGGA